MLCKGWQHLQVTELLAQPIGHHTANKTARGLRTDVACALHNYFTAIPYFSV